MGWVVNATPQLLYPRERDPLLILQKAGWPPPTAGLKEFGKCRLPTGIRSPDCPTIARRYTDCAVLCNTSKNTVLKS